jgi:hypothetical protein
MSHRDPIIEELHRLREAIGRAHGFDVRRIAATIRQHELEGLAASVQQRGEATTGGEGAQTGSRPVARLRRSGAATKSTARGRRAATQQRQVLRRPAER